METRFWQYQFIYRNTEHTSSKDKFTQETDKESIPFLDIIIYKEGTEIKTDIYHKPTDTFQYLHYYSCHPRHTKNNIPFNLARRVCTIVSDSVRKQQRLLELKDRLIQRNYPDTLVDSSIILKAENIPRGELLKQPKRDESWQHNDLSTYISSKGAQSLSNN